MNSEAITENNEIVSLDGATVADFLVDDRTFRNVLKELDSGFFTSARKAADYLIEGAAHAGIWVSGASRDALISFIEGCEATN